MLPEEKKETEVEEEQRPSSDVFGDNIQQPNKEEKKEDVGEEKKFDPIPKEHPTIVELQKQIEDVKTNYGGNLSAQREVIKGLRDQIDVLKQGLKSEESKEESDLPFPDIKWVKDMTDEEKEEMTDTEMKQADQIAKMQQMENDRYLADKNRQKENSETAVENIQGTVKTAAKDLAKNEDGSIDEDLANQIIENVKHLNFNLEGLSEDEIKERVNSAYKLLPNYQPPKEQTPIGGKPIKTNKSSNDIFKSDQIIEEALKGGDGDYDL